LQCVALCCSVLHCITVLLQRRRLRIDRGSTSVAGVLQCVAVCCSADSTAIFLDSMHDGDCTFIIRPDSVAVCCSVLQCITVCCSVLQCVAATATVHSPRVSQCCRSVAECCSVFQCFAVCYSVLQCVAVCRSVMQCVAVCCIVLQCATVRCSDCNILQCVHQIFGKQGSGIICTTKLLDLVVQPIPPGVTFSNAVSKLRAQSSNVSFATFQWKETLEL